MRVAAHPHRDNLDQRRAGARTRPVGRPGERGGDRVRIGAVDGDARNAVPERLVGEDARRGVLGHRRRQRRLVVLQAEHRGQLAHGAQVDGLVPLAERRTALADERQSDPPRPLAPEPHREAGDAQRSDRQRRRRRQHAPGPVAGVQVLAEHRRTGLAHLRAEHLPHGLFVVAHRQRDAEVANDRREHVAVPRAVRILILRPAPQPDAAGVDGLLSERAEALTLKRLVAPADLAAHEELLEPIVDGARQHHAAQNLAPLVSRQRDANRFAREKAVARLDDLRTRLLQPLDRGHARRRLVDAVRRGQQVVEPLGELAAKRRTQRFDLLGVAVARRTFAHRGQAIRGRASGRAGDVRRQTRRDDYRDQKGGRFQRTGTSD